VVQVAHHLLAHDFDGFNSMTRMVTRRVRVSTLWGVALAMAYDANGNQTLETDSLGGTLTSTYDRLNRLKAEQFSDANGNQLSFGESWTARGQLASVTRYSDAAGTQQVGVSSYTYDPQGHMLSINHVGTGGTSLASYSYKYDLANRLTSESDNGGASIVYSYDKANQLLGDGTHTYTYDAADNPTSNGLTPGPGNQLKTDGTWNYTYDKNGNQQTKTNPKTGETWTYSFNEVNQLIQAVDTTSSGTTTVTYKYDALGNQVEHDVQVNGGAVTITRYVVDNGGHVIADLDGSNTLLVRYFYDQNQVAPLARIQYNGTSGTPAWYLTDHLGSVIGLMGNAGTLLASRSYDPFGNIVSQTGTTTWDRFGFTGEPLDSVTGQQQNNQRWYNAATMQWTTRDPLGFGAGQSNLYEYAGNSPLDYTDPSGAFWGYPGVGGGSAGGVSAGGSSGSSFLMSMLDGYLESSPGAMMGFSPAANTNTGWGNLLQNLYYLGPGGGEMAAYYVREQLRYHNYNQQAASLGAAQTPFNQSPFWMGESEGGNALWQGLQNVREGFNEAPWNFWNGLVEQYKETKDSGQAVLSAASYYTNQWGWTNLYVVDQFESQLWQGSEKAYTQGYNGETGSSAAMQFAWDYKTNQLLGMIPYSGLVSGFNHAVETGDWTPYQKASGENAFWTLMAVVWAKFAPDEGGGGGGAAKEGGGNAPVKSGLSNAGRLSADELATGQRLEAQLGKPLKESPHVGAEFVDDLGRSYDALGTPKASQFWNEKQFLNSIDGHLLKSNNFTVIDLTGFTPAQIAAVTKHLATLTPAQLARIIKIGF
jgi:RHS repeat-associated protein